MDKDLRSELIKVFSNFNIPKMAVFEQISVKKLKYAKQSYGQSLEKNEVVVLLYDGTAFGSAKNGLMLTDQKIYFKNILQSSEILELGDVVSFSEKSRNEFNVNLRNGIVLPITSSDTTKTSQKVSLLNEMLIVLKKGLLAISKSVGRNLICKGCGANIENQIGRCKYCRTAI